MNNIESNNTTPQEKQTPPSVLERYSNFYSDDEMGDIKEEDHHLHSRYQEFKKILDANPEATYVLELLSNPALSVQLFSDTIKEFNSVYAQELEHGMVKTFIIPLSTHGRELAVSVYENGAMSLSAKFEQN